MKPGRKDPSLTEEKHSLPKLPRGLLLLALLAILLVLPFAITSVYVDTRGLSIPGTVSAKREDLKVVRSDWTRSSEVTIEYTIPETGGVSFLTLDLPPERYDSLHLGQKVTLHYLRREDVPKFPLARALRELHVLPMVRLADQRAFAELDSPFASQIGRAIALAAVIMTVLVLWRKARIPGFGWALAIVLLPAFTWLVFYDFPRPTPPPLNAVRQADGRVKRLERIDRLLETNRNRGVDAHQPIDVAAIEFVPERSTEPVLAVDLIDAGSVSGLKEGLIVSVQYEAATPRIAHIRTATRTFLSRNLMGLAEDAAICLIVICLMLWAWFVIKRIGRRLVSN